MKSVASDTHRCNETVNRKLIAKCRDYCGARSHLAFCAQIHDGRVGWDARRLGMIVRDQDHDVGTVNTRTRITRNLVWRIGEAAIARVAGADCQRLG